MVGLQWTNTQIAAELYYSPRSVAAYLGKLYAKLNFRGNKGNGYSNQKHKFLAQWSLANLHHKHRFFQTVT